MLTLNKKLFLWNMILLVFITSKGIAQNNFDNKSRAEYIVSISKYVVWANEEEIKEFTIGVLDSDTNLVSKLNKHIAKIQNRKGKPLKIIHFKSLNELQHCQVIFMNKKDGFDISAVQEVIAGTNTLLISENYPFHKSMINFIVINGQKNFEVNKAKIEAEGFWVSETFLALAIHTKADWEKIYEQTEYLLAKEKAIVESQKKLIEQQKQDIKEQIELLNQQKHLISLQQLQIDTQRVELLSLEHNINEKQEQLKQKLLLLTKQKKAIQSKEQELNSKQLQIEESNITLALQKNEISKQATKIKEQRSSLNQQVKEIEKQRLILYFLYVVIVLVLIAVYSIFRNYRIKRKANIQLKEKNEAITLKNREIESQRDELMEQNEEIMLQKEEIQQQKEEILTQRDEIEKQRDVAEEQRDQIKSQNRQITDSIVYAKRIQSAILTLPNFLEQYVHQYFILFKPKDIVSGDFYWATKQNDKLVIAAVDCTGHGVPGAFMSMLGVTFLNEIVDNQKITEPAQILDKLREHVISSLKQSGKIGEVKEGMDMSICSIDIENQILEFAGATNSIVIIRNAELMEIKGDNMPVSIIDDMQPFTNHQYKLQRGDTIYMFSDGYADQFGGKHGRKFMSKRLKSKLLDIHLKPMTEQQKILEATFTAWIQDGKYDQIDDVLVMGIKY